jgi:hypothetical protein
MAEGETIINALIGAVVGAIAGVILPFGPLLGGMAAGYLEGGTRSNGLRVGTYAGLIALVPLVLGGFGLVAALGLFTVGAGTDALAVGGIGILVLIAALVFAVVYTIGLSALGGWLGNYIKQDTDIGS